MSDEFRVHHCTSQLLNLLGTDSSVSAADITDHLLQNKTPFKTTQVNTHSAVLHISERAAKPQEFIHKYEELKAKNVRDLDSLLFLLSKVIEDTALHELLTKVARKRGDAIKMIPQLPPSGMGSSLVSLPPSGSKLSPEELIKLRNTIEKATQSSSYPSVDAYRKSLLEKNRTRNPQNTFPTLPPWLHGTMRKPNLSYNFVIKPRTQHLTIPLTNISVQRQEQNVVKDLLAILSGVEGHHILVHPGEETNAQKRFIIEPTMDVSLAEMSNMILPIASSYSTVISFIEEKSSFEYGQVNHALCFAMKNIIREYQINLAQLDDQFRHGDLPLQRLVFLLQPVVQQMDILASVATAIDLGHCTGGAILSLLHNRISASVGDKAAEQLYVYLTQLASIPYMEMLEKWIYKGETMDPYGEFLVEEKEKISKEQLLEDYNDQYWESRYTLCRDRIPVYLEQVAEKILSTGKYLNVVHECGRTVSYPGAREIIYSHNRREYVQQIEQAHSYASKLLLDLLMQEYNLEARLKSVKSYFLLNEGDFLLHFMDLTEKEMRMPMQDIIPNRLEALLELALRTSLADHDVYKDDLKIVLLNYDLITQLVRILSIDTVEEQVVKSLDPTELNLTGLESFALDYTVRWPLSLVISRKSLTKYQMLFRHLFYCKHVERHLSTIWMKFKSLKMHVLHSKPWFLKALTVMQKMLHFIQNFEYYMMFEVLEPNWLTMEKNLNSASNVDDVLDFHADFLKQCLQDCLLTNTELLRMLSKLLMLCISYANYMQDLCRQVGGFAVSDSLEHSTLAGPPTAQEKRHESGRIATITKETTLHFDDLASSPEHLGLVQNYEVTFTNCLMSLLNRVAFISREQGQHCLFNIMHKLDYNGFYQSHMKDSEDVQENDPSLVNLIKQHHKMPVYPSVF
ncbi:gamma-tubulin complex component 2-like [Clavelina lepadiformis]|uniref:Gamma-tubulin complex component n=1 Tax=Clavelina lepadiformis TaxID=159417 RepID=A0ABP0H212_CLALP